MMQGILHVLFNQFYPSYYPFLTNEYIKRYMQLTLLTFFLAFLLVKNESITDSSSFSIPITYFNG